MKTLKTIRNVQISCAVCSLTSLWSPFSSISGLWKRVLGFCFGGLGEGIVTSVEGEVEFEFDIAIDYL